MGSQAAAVMSSVLQALDAGRGSDAVNAFVAALSHETVGKNVDLPAWLMKKLGRERMARLIRAFARHPCMGCKAGLLVCDECAGKGLDPRGAICERCIGLGAANCPFCGGSGWITYNYVPAALLSLVVMERSRGVLEVAGEVLAQPAPTADTRPAPSRAALIRQLVRLNRLLGAINNAIAVAKNPPPGDLHAERLLPKIRRVCASGAAKLERRVRLLLMALARRSRDEAGATANPISRQLALQRSEYYAGLAQSPSFAGTSLFHVHLGELHER